MGRLKQAHIPARTTKKYTEQQQMDAVIAMFSVNRQHPMSIDGMNAARDVLGAPVGTGTLGRWCAMYGARVLAQLPPIPADSITVPAGQQTILNDFVSIRQKATDHLNADGVIGATSGRDAAVILGILDDHIVRMTELSPDIVTRVKQIAADCTAGNLILTDVLDDIHARLSAYAASLRPSVIDMLASGEVAIEAPAADDTP